jgi:hypothetical protein
MEDDVNEALQFETLAAALKLGRAEEKDLVESLAHMLTLSLPDRTSITRGGWLLSREKPIQELTIRFEDFHYRVTKEGSGYSAKALKIVRGVALKTTDMELEACFKSIIEELTNLADKNAKARDALQRFVSGG